VTEAELLAAVIETARVLGWRTAHFRAARRAHGWSTPLQGDAAGFVDLVLVRERIVAVELKTERGRLRPEQESWLEALERAGAEVHIWRPTDWTTGAIEACLRTPFFKPQAPA